MPPSRQHVGASALSWFLPLVVLSATLTGQADPPLSEADKALQRLKEALAAEQGLSPETRTAMEDFFDALSADAARKLDSAQLELELERLAVRPSEPGKWEKVKERLTVSGDMRLREEYNFDLDDQPPRARTRYRLRIGGVYKVDDDWTVGARLRTGDPGDPNSPHSTLGDVFDSDAFSLDRAYISYRAECLDGAKLTGGKFQHPFYVNPVYGELVWDADINPEGVVGSYTFAGDDPRDKVDIYLGYYMTLETAGNDSSISVAQIGGTKAFSEQSSGMLAVGYYDYTNLTPDGNQALVNDNPSQTAGGNALVDTNGDTVLDDYLSDFAIWNPLGAWTYTGWGTPVVFSAEYIKNTQAQGSLDTGYALGTSVGQQKKKGDWQGYYQWQKVEQDAVFAAFAQDDFLLASNQTGHVFGTRYRITDDVGAHLWALVSARDEEGTSATTDSRQSQWRVRFDIDIRF